MTAPTHALTDYPGTCTFAGNAIGQYLIIDYPEIKTDKIEMTNHGSGGVREYIPNGLVGLEDITLSVLLATGTITTLDTALDAKTIGTVVLHNPHTTMTFSGFIQSVKVESADATSPDVSKATVVISPTGAIVFS